MQMVRRAEWGARNPKTRPVKATLTGLSTGHWEGPTMRVAGQLTWDHSKCASLVRGIQNFHMDGRGWNDIAYNFVVCPHGFTFEGRGINVVNGANGTNAGNRSSHAVCCLAGIDNPFDDVEKRGFRETVSFIAQNSSAPDSAIGHRDHKATQCPGDGRYHWIHSGMPIDGVAPQPTPDPGPAQPGPSGRATLGTGRANPKKDVLDLQKVLRANGAVNKMKPVGRPLSADGIWGPNTEQAVLDIQRFFGLRRDGIVGDQTWAVIFVIAVSLIQQGKLTL